MDFLDRRSFLAATGAAAPVVLQAPAVAEPTQPARPLSVVPHVAALRALAPTAAFDVNTQGYHAPGDGGGACYGAASGAAGSYVDNGGDVIVPAGGDGSAAWLSRGALLRARQWGLKPDGATDNSARAQIFVDANKGERLVFDGAGQYLMAGLRLAGAAYNGTRLVFEAELLLKPRPDKNGANFLGPAYVGVGFEHCENCGLEGRFHGNRLAQPQEEHLYCIALAAVREFTIPHVAIREIRGDGVMITGSHPQRPPAKVKQVNTSGVTIGSIVGYNSQDDGRNLVSIISGDDISIGLFVSRGVGAVIEGANEPGGLDIEPDGEWQSCKRIIVGALNVTTAGANGLCISGIAGADVTRDVRIGAASVVNTCAPTLPDGKGAIATTNNHTLAIINAADVAIAEFSGAFTKAWGDGVIVSNSDNVRLTGAVDHVREGARIGSDAFDEGMGAEGVRNSQIDLRVSRVALRGFRVGRVADSVISGVALEPQPGLYDGSQVAVVLMSGGLSSPPPMQSNVVYSVDTPFHRHWTRAYRIDPFLPVLTDAARPCRIRHAAFGPGWPDYRTMKDAPLLVEDCPGYSDGPFGQPTVGTHIA
ncbi:MAG: hypothetical protein KGL46_01225, partial [Hyphomicrobiales bacterium]|nr:hypothetical protein [Hyphomicrobiales bacterium]